MIGLHLLFIGKLSLYSRFDLEAREGERLENRVAKALSAIKVGGRIEHQHVEDKRAELMHFDESRPVDIPLASGRMFNHVFDVIDDQREERM